MTADLAWDTISAYARTGGIPLQRGAAPKEMRRALAKRYQPRKAGDDDEPMRRINAAIEILLAEEAVRELCGDAEPPPKPQPAAAPPRPAAGAARPTPGPTSQWGARAAAALPPSHAASGLPPWQTDAAAGAAVAAPNYTDLNFIRREVYERSARFGDTETVKAWAWAGDGFRKMVAVQCNDFALEELGRALLYYQTNGPEPTLCRAVFATRGAGRVRRFQLLLLRMGRLCEDVSKYDWTFEEEPDAPGFATRLNRWLDGVEATLDSDR